MGKIIRNLIGILLLVTAIAVTQIPVSDVEAAPTASASDFQMDGTTLVKYKGTAQDVSVSDYVEKIEAEAFAGNDDIRHITVGENVEVIGARAFSECKNLESVTIPDSVKTIDTAAFSGCPSLKEVTVGTGLTSLGNGAFAGAYSLENVRFSSSNPKFTCDEGAILNKDGRDTLYQFLAGTKGDSYRMPSTVKTIKPYAFWGNYNLEQVELSNQVKEIPAYAFSTCRNLKDVEIPFSVKSIDMKAFEDCVRLREIVIPASVSTIHSTAFDGCTKLEIKADAGSMAHTFAQSLELEDIEVSEYEEAPIPGSVSGNDVVADAAAQGGEDGGNVSAPVDYYHEVSHMNPMTEEEDNAVKGKTRVIGRQAYVIIDNATATINVGSTGDTIGGEPEEETEQNTDTVPGLAGSGDAKGGSFPKYAIAKGSDGKAVVAAQAYYDNEMTSYTIPDNIVRIGEFSFARSGLTAITIPDGVEEIGYAAFYHCDALKDVSIPQSVQNIEAAAFANTPWLSEWRQNGSGDFLIVGDGILLAYKGSGNVVSVPEGVKRIGAEAFKDHTEINKVVLPNSVEVVGEAAFAGCSALMEIEGGAGLRKISDRAFAGCPVGTVHIPATVEYVGLRAFDSTDPESGTTAGNRAVVFEGGKLPQLSYEKMATKLYRDSDREPALKGCAVAVIPDGVNDLTGSVLADTGAGFTGVVCRKAQDAADGGGVLQIVSRQGSGPLLQAGDTCQIDGKQYVLEEGTQIAGGSNTAGQPDGAGEAASREAGADASDSSDPAGVSGSADPGVAVQIKSSTLSDNGVAGAVLAGSEENYILTIEDNEAAGLKIGDVYKKIYGNTLPQNLCAYDIGLTEAATGVPITSLGKQSVEVTLPMPGGVGADNLHVVCLDADGQLEEVDSRVVSVNGADAIIFTARHFSPYGIYNYGSGRSAAADVKDGQAVFTSLGTKDDSPDTGDHSIHPKWFLSGGLFFAAMAFFFYRRKGRKIPLS